MSSIENNICEAVEIIVDKVVSQAGYDRTIQVSIVSCVDEVLGKYKVKHQDSTYFAYSTSPDIVYMPNTMVYLLIPSNDMSKDKTILGAVDKLNSTYGLPQEKEDVFEIYGNNLVKGEQCVLNSYEEKEIILYNVETQTNKLELDVESANRYLKDAKYILCGFNAKTSLPIEQQTKGNYGLEFGLSFLDNATQAKVIRRFIIDVNNMTGNPYRLVSNTRQYGIFEIDNNNFQRVEYIKAFVKDFPHQRLGENDDIFLSSFELSGQNLLNAGATDYITFKTLKGILFKKDALLTDELTVQAEVFQKGKLLKSENLEFYWFKEDLTVSTKLSEGFNQYGGSGWRCLNKFNIVGKNNDGIDLVEWIPDKDTLFIKKEDVQLSVIRYKCVIIYQGAALSSRELIIYNEAPEYNISISSIGENGEQTEFYYDNGYPTLTCSVEKDGVDITNQMSYQWMEINNVGLQTELEETVSLNDEYNKLIAEIKTAEDLIVTNNLQKNTTEYNKQQKIIDSNNKILNTTYKNVTRIEKNKIINLNINNIVNTGRYGCAVFKKDGSYIGTGSIVLYNKLIKEPGYTLIINNGTQIYKYNENGVSPANKSMENPINILALSFDIYDNLGVKLSEDILKHCDISWVVPSKDTLLDFSDTGLTPEKSEADQTITYKQHLSLPYSLATNYDIKKNKNDVLLKVKYKDIELEAKTNFTFLKEGESGTSGRDIVCKIVPNAIPGTIIPYYPAYNYPMNGSGELNYLLDTSLGKDVWFKAELWENGTKIFSSNTSGIDDLYGENVSVTWSILKNLYSNKNNVKNEDKSFFNITSNSGVVTPITRADAEKIKHPANIFKVSVEYSGGTYVATLPLITTGLSKNTSPTIRLKDYTGFTSVIYDSNGQFPKYNSDNAFEIECLDNNNNNNANDYSYSWNKNGRLADENADNSDLIIQDKSKTEYDCQKIIVPKEEYSGECVTNGIKVIITQNNDNLGWIHIPIDFYVNRYSHPHINAWDGNSVQINEEGGYILSPQVGAGSKNTQNQFTGVLMGEVKEAGVKESDIGLIGYSNGQRSFFIDSKTGSSTFGVQGAGQVIINPTVNQAIIKSGNYDEKNKTGMQINLSEPSIKFGSGNFSVNANGNITAKSGGTIAGWNIGVNSLSTGESKNTNYINLSSVDFTKTINSTNRTDWRMTFGNYFGVTNTGILYSSVGVIGAGTNKITIGKSATNTNASAIYSGSKSSFNATSQGFYLGTDGISLGTISYINANGNTTETHSKFEVSSSGELIARSGYIGNGRAGWTIDRTSIYNEKSAIDSSSSGVYIGTDGIALGAEAQYTLGDGKDHAKFEVTSSGKLYAKDGIFEGQISATKGAIGGWIIESDRLKNENGAISISKNGINYNNKFKVSSSGSLTSTSGSIGGWTINAESISRGSIILGNNQVKFGEAVTITPTELAVRGNNGLTLHGKGIYIWVLDILTEECRRWNNGRIGVFLDALENDLKQYMENNYMKKIL